MMYVLRLVSMYDSNVTSNAATKLARMSNARMTQVARGKIYFLDPYPGVMTKQEPRAPNPVLHLAFSRGFT